MFAFTGNQIMGSVTGTPEEMKEMMDLVTAGKAEPVPIIKRKLDEADATLAGTALGTPAFMAPEQAMGSREGLDGRAEVGLEQQRARAGMVQHVDQLHLRQADVDRHDDAAGHDHAVVSFQELVRIETQVRHPVPRQHAQLFQPRGQPLAARAELGVGKLLVAADHPDFPGKYIHRAIKEPNGSER